MLSIINRLIRLIKPFCLLFNLISIFYWFYLSIKHNVIDFYNEYGWSNFL